MNNSIDFYLKKYEKLNQSTEHCLKQSRKLADTTEIEQEISQKTQKVEQLKNLKEYFEQVGKVLKEIEDGKEEEFKNELLKQNWKFGLERLVQLIDENETKNNNTFNTFNCLNNLKWGIINNRINLFHETISKRIRTYVEGLGWPKIISNEETAEIISRLQELLTYGEAIYLLSSTSEDGTDYTESGESDLSETKLSTSPSQLNHPIVYFIDPIKLRFNYHFNSDRPTNQLDKPEWYFDNLISICRENLAFLWEFILPCWRLRDMDDFLKNCIVNLAVEKTKSSLANISETDSLRIHYLLEFGKFLNSLRDEFGFVEIDGIIEEVFITDLDEFVESELTRIRNVYSTIFNETDEWTPHEKNSTVGEPSSVALKFLSFFHSSMILPYSFIRQNMKIRASLLYRVQSWALETFYEKCQFECSPLHTSRENILKDIGMINSFAVICKVLGDDFGESLDYLELSASEELHELIGYDPSGLPGTCFNKAIEAFKKLSDKLSSHVFNYTMERFLKPAGVYSNSMIYARVESEESASIPDDLRLSLSNLAETLKFIRRFLCDAQFTRLFKQTLPEKLASFMFQGVLLKNFFTESGAARFQQDLNYVQESLCHVDEMDPGYINETFSRVTEAVELLKIKERDPTAPFDGARLTRLIRENRVDDLKRFLEMMRLTKLKVEDLSQIFASRRHQ